jgi:hypothetical protein
LSDILGAGLTAEITRRALRNSVLATVAAKHERDAALATIERVKALVDEHDDRGATWVVRRVRAVLEETL